MDEPEDVPEDEPEDEPEDAPEVVPVPATLELFNNLVNVRDPLQPCPVLQTNAAPAQCSSLEPQHSPFLQTNAAPAQCSSPEPQHSPVLQTNDNQYSTVHLAGVVFKSEV